LPRGFGREKSPRDGEREQPDPVSVCHVACSSDRRELDGSRGAVRVRPLNVDLRHPLFVSNSQIAAIAEGRAEWVKPTLEREFAVAVVRPQGAQKLPLRATLPLSRPQLSTP